MSKLFERLKNAARLRGDAHGLLTQALQRAAAEREHARALEREVAASGHVAEPEPEFVEPVSQSASAAAFEQSAALMAKMAAADALEAQRVHAQRELEEREAAQAIYARMEADRIAEAAALARADSERRAREAALERAKADEEAEAAALARAETERTAIEEAQRRAEAERRATHAALARRYAEERAHATELARAEAEEEALMEARRRVEAEAARHEEECARLEASERALHAAAERARVDQQARAVQMSSLEARESTESALRSERELDRHAMRRRLTRALAGGAILIALASALALSARFVPEPDPPGVPVFQLDRSLK